MPVFERNLVALEDFYLAVRRSIELYLPDVTPDLHAVSSGIHPQSAADGAGDADQPLHAAEVVLRAEGHRATEVRCGIYLGERAFDDDVRIRPHEIQDDPRKLSVAD